MLASPSATERRRSYGRVQRRARGGRPRPGPRIAGTSDLELRFLRNELGCENCGVTYERLAAGWAQPAGHRHKRQEEIYLLVSGRAQAKLDDEVIDLEPWTALRVPPQTVRALRSVGEEDAVFVAVGAPNTGPGDSEFVPGFWDS